MIHANLPLDPCSNGLTDPRAQTQTLASAAYFHGLLPPAQRDEVAARAAAVVALVDEGKWEAAQRAREELRRCGAKACAGVVRRVGGCRGEEARAGASCG